MRQFKRFLPSAIRNYLRDRSRRSRFLGLSAKETFDKIYKEKYWGVDSEGWPSSGTGSHEANIVEPYIEKMSDFLRSLGQPKVVDLGCGDFNIGIKLVGLAGSYIACDISETIIGINRERYARPNLEFRVVNIVEDELPRADVCVIRQVLQHLSNRDIQAFVKRLQTEKPYRYVVVTEHVATGAGHAINIDKPTGPGTRVEKSSGVDLALPPFNFLSEEKSEMLEVRQDSDGVLAAIVTTLYRL